MMVKALMNVIPKKWSAQDVDDIKYYEADYERIEILQTIIINLPNWNRQCAGWWYYLNV